MNLTTNPTSNCPDFTAGFPEYTSKSRFPKAQPKGICRGCRGPITDPRRQTWCSGACQKKYHPFYVKQAVRVRDGNKCVLCGKDCHRNAERAYCLAYKPKAPDYLTCGCQWPYDLEAHHNSPLYRQYAADMVRWEGEMPKAEFDHIKPHSEGGLFVLENIRLLCRKCHKARTKEWHQQRASIRKSLVKSPVATMA